MRGGESRSQERASMSSSWKLLWGEDGDKQAFPSLFSLNAPSIPFCARMKDPAASRTGTPAPQEHLSVWEGRKQRR